MNPSTFLIDSLKHPYSTNLANTRSSDIRSDQKAICLRVADIAFILLGNVEILVCGWGWGRLDCR